MAIKTGVEKVAVARERNIQSAAKFGGCASSLRGGSRDYQARTSSVLRCPSPTITLSIITVYYSLVFVLTAICIFNVLLDQSSLRCLVKTTKVVVTMDIVSPCLASAVRLDPV